MTVTPAYPRRAALSALVGGLLIAASVRAQTRPAAESPRLGLKGYDPVAYFTDGRPMQGKPEFEQVFDETRYRFASERHLALFKADPDKYVPQFGGSCAMGMALGRHLEADPNNWLIADGRLYVFAAPSLPDRFRTDAGAKQRAEETWRKQRQSN